MAVKPAYILAYAESLAPSLNSLYDAALHRRSIGGVFFDICSTVVALNCGIMTIARDKPLLKCYNRMAFRPQRITCFIPYHRTKNDDRSFSEHHLNAISGLDEQDRTSRRLACRQVACKEHKPQGGTQKDAQWYFHRSLNTFAAQKAP